MRKCCLCLCLVAILLAAAPCLAVQVQNIVLQGSVLDRAGNGLKDAALQILKGGQTVAHGVSSEDGHFQLIIHITGDVLLHAELAGFQPVTQPFQVKANANPDIVLRFVQLAPRIETVTVTANAAQGDIAAPDSAMKIFAAEDLLDANPGRPGAPISIPGYPIETASGGIKAPQYFAPGVAGDHGEPIAQYIQVGSYLLPNNLSANAHGNGYSDPNIFIANVIDSVQVDGGAFNVLEGNHALNLAATYTLRSHLTPFVSLTLDHRDATLTAGVSPTANTWLALEGSYGNGFLDRLEHRKQFKFNGGATFRAGHHTLTLLGIAYYGFGYVAGLRPIYGFNSVDTAAGWLVYPDTIDPRQKEQTHTALIALNDGWKLDDRQNLQLSAFFRTYNLSLLSDFGLGLIRQSEFRTVTGANATYVNQFSKKFTLLAGTDFLRDAPRRDNLDHYNFYDPANPNFYGPFVKISSNNLTITPISPYIAVQGAMTPNFLYYLGWRRDQIFLDNRDLLSPENSSNHWAGLNSPKATFTFVPKESWLAPLVSLSFGKSFFTEDPRVGTNLNNPVSPNLVETARSYQLVVGKTIRHTDLKLTLGHETQTAEFGKIDPDQGLQFDLGPGRIRYLAATVRQSFANGSLQATFEQADARLVHTSFSIIPEAPRLIGDLLGTYQKLPFHLQAKGEFEYVGRKVLGNGCNEQAYLSGDPNALNYYCLGVPNKEFRFALGRPFRDGRIYVGVNAMVATGWTGQTTENFATAAVYAPGKAGLASNGLVPANPVSEVVGVRFPSYASLNITYRFLP